MRGPFFGGKGGAPYIDAAPREMNIYFNKPPFKSVDHGPSMSFQLTFWEADYVLKVVSAAAPTLWVVVNSFELNLDHSSKGTVMETPNRESKVFVLLDALECSSEVR